MYVETDARFQRLELKVGVFVAVAIVGCLAILVYLAIAGDLFTSRYQLQFTVDKGTGFSKGMPVKLSGFRIGRVGEVRLNDQARVDIRLDIDRRYARWIREDSQATLVTEGLVGDAIVEITAGSEELPELSGGDTIRFEASRTLDELVAELAGEARPVLVKVRDFVSYVDDPDGDLKQSLKQIHLLARDLNDTRTRFDALLESGGSGVGKVLRRAEGTLSQFDSSLQRVDSLLSEVETSLPGMMESMETTLGNVATLSGEVRSTADTVLPRVPALVDEAGSVLGKADAVLDSVNDMWLFRSPSPERVPLVIKGDSHE